MLTGRSLCCAGLLASTILACWGCPDSSQNGGAHTHEFTMKFAARVGDQDVRCGQTYTGLGATGLDVQIHDLRFYISNVRVITDSGDEIPVTLEQDGKWQVQNVALLDFEDASNGCSDTGTADINTVVRGTAPLGTHTGVVFDLCVPFDLNHKDLATSPSPLNVSAMFWTWAVGHKFVRVDLETADGMPWFVHVGSTGCISGGAIEPPVQECGKPNVATIRLRSFDHAVDTVIFDLRALLAGVDLTRDTPDTSAGCQSFPDDVNECPSVFASLGLDFSTGKCRDGCAEQTVFKVLSGAIRGQQEYVKARPTSSGEVQSCINCHGADASGGIGPDLRPSTGDHAFEHAYGTGPHPVKFPDLTEEEALYIGAFLKSQCQADPNCKPASSHAGHPH
jgi:uncharacterized repeat protein (TIGR04052 family)